MTGVSGLAAGHPHSGRFPSSPPAVVGRGFPWALVVAVVILLVVELIVRMIPAQRLIAYERGVPERFAARQHIQAFGAPEVMFVGSSRVHLGIVMPEVLRVLEAEVGRPVSAANFASGGSLVQELGPFIEHTLRNRPLPKIICYGVDPEQISRPEMYNERASVYWSFPDWWARRQEFGAVMDDYLPHVVRNSLADHWLTFRYRNRPINLIKAMARGRETSPMLGEYLAPEHTTDRGRTLVEFPADEAEVKHHVEAGHLDNGVYPFNMKKVEWFKEFIGHCRRDGVEVVLFEVPNADVFNRYLPDDVHATFYSHMREIAVQSGARFVSLEGLGLKFTDAEFRDPVHLNYKGSMELSDALSGKVLAPMLRAAAGGRGQQGTPVKAGEPR